MSDTLEYNVSFSSYVWRQQLKQSIEKRKWVNLRGELEWFQISWLDMWFNIVKFCLKHWTYGPTYCLSLDTCMCSESHRVCPYFPGFWQKYHLYFLVGHNYRNVAIYTFCSRVGLGMCGARLPLLCCCECFPLCESLDCDIWWPLDVPWDWGALVKEGTLDCATVEVEGSGWDFFCVVPLLSWVIEVFEILFGFAAFCSLLAGSDGFDSFVAELGWGWMDLGDTCTGNVCFGTGFMGELGFTKIERPQINISSSNDCTWEEAHVW